MKIILHGNPYSTNNIYYHKGRMAFIKPKPKKQKEDWRLEAIDQWVGKPLSGELGVEITIFFGTKRRSDWDNYHKLAMDALTGVVWEDDSQIRRAIVSLDYCKNDPRIEINVCELTSMVWG